MKPYWFVINNKIFIVNEKDNPMKIDLSNIPIEVMDTPTKKELGMMGREELNGAMVFPFDEIGERSFWMKNCKIPLDIIFVIDGEIQDIHHNAPPCEEDCERYQGIADTIIEFNGGYSKKNGLEIGDKIE